ncbi:hypothetical protein FHT87_005195 [Rhizobium sp. BK316]|uniref:hypothetical protein n=1 Tax=Rhizobium sp. BK316 TaxID=2587053 RepID=UPI00161CFAC5|nr:hypothetical protein [Rhizobium sp. BK316]MBB3411242.1 hypothetical protein [Rhizobium sp. BK316]
MKPKISVQQELLLAYLSSWGPLGSIVAFNMDDAAHDLGYKDKRNIYTIVNELADMGLAQRINSKRRWGRTEFVCHVRPEQCEVVTIARVGAPKGTKRQEHRKVTKTEKATQRPPVAVSVPKPVIKTLIHYAGFDKRERAFA